MKFAGLERTLSAAIETTPLHYTADRAVPQAEFLGVSKDTWLRVLVITGLFAAVFWSNLRRLWLKTNPISGEPNWSHSIFVPLIGLYYLYVHREELIRAGSKDFLWGPIIRLGRLAPAFGMMGVGTALYLLFRNPPPGLIYSFLSPGGAALAILGALVLLLDWSLATTLFGIAVFIYGFYPGKNDYLNDLGMVITLFGIVLLLNGWEVMKIAWFPIVFLICALPWPPLVYSWVAEPLQQMAAHIGVDVLRITGVDATYWGTKIQIFGQPNQPPRTLNVAEACAGMRSLMTFISIAAAVAFLSMKPLWQRLTIVASAVPIAIFCNMLRISVVGLLDHYVSTQWSDSFAHQVVGTVLLAPAFLLIIGVSVALDKVFIEEADDEEIAGATSGGKPAVIIARSAAAAASPAPAVAPVPAPAQAKPAASAPAAPAVAKPATVAQKAAGVATPQSPATSAVPSSKPPTAVTPPRPAAPAATRPAGVPAAGPVSRTPPRPASAPLSPAQRAPAAPAQAAPPRTATTPPAYKPAQGNAPRPTSNAGVPPVKSQAAAPTAAPAVKPVIAPVSPPSSPKESL